MATEGLDPKLAPIPSKGEGERGGVNMVESISIGALDSPIGILQAACSEQGVCRIVFPKDAKRHPLERWIGEHLPGAHRTAASALLEQTLTELTEYFEGTRHRFTLPLDLQGNAFEQRVWEALTHIPYGQTLAYGSIARQLNDPRAARAVGSACGANPVPIIVP